MQGKLLLIHGMVNTMAPPATTFRLVQALMDANKDFDMLLIPKMGHELFSGYVMRRSWDYLIRHLMGAEPPKQFDFLDDGSWTGYDHDE